MELTLKSAQIIFNDNAPVLIAVLSSIFVLCFGIVVSRVTTDLFSLYQRRFYSQVDQGLRDVLVMMDVQQVFAITFGVTLVVFPLFYWFFNFLVAGVVASMVLVAPPLVLRIMKNRRSDKFVKQLPDALAAMSSALKSGMNLVKTLQQVVRNQPQPLAQEFAQVLVEYRVGTDMNDSFNDLAKRIGRQEVVLMNSAIKINRAVGGNLSETFESLASTLRERYKVEGKIRALTSMGESQGRLAIGFPIMMGYVFYKQEPFAMGLLFTTQLGWVWLGIMITMAFLGTFFIKKIVNIDV